MILGIALSLVFALVGAGYASASGRDRKAGFVLGLLLGPLAPMAMRDHERDPEARSYARAQRRKSSQP